MLIEWLAKTNPFERLAVGTSIEVKWLAPDLIPSGAQGVA
jgi:hypothetical protein